MKLTAEQRAAVEREGQDVCVVAGPGSGKTRVLVERFRWLVGERSVDPLRILAVTFTEKAANEIKGRLVRQFSGNTPLRERIERAWISTIDGFCARLLREHAIAAGVDPRFEILDERFGDAGMREAAREALDRTWAGQPHGITQLLDGWRAEDPSGALVDAYNTLRASDVSVDNLLQQPAQLGPPYFDEILTELRAAMCQPPRTAAQRSKLLDLKSLHDQAAALRSVPLSETHFDVVSACSALRKGEPFAASIRRIKDVLLPLEHARLITEYYQEGRAILADALVLLDRLYSSQKRARGVLDFADLEHFAVRLLEGNAQVRDVVQSSFDAILMDELQDTNRLQAHLVDLIRRPGRFFAVGDMNQSIFGFRHADPDVFRQYRDLVAASGSVDLLTENFRSREGILSAVSAALSAAQGIEPFALIAAREFPASADPAVELVHAASEDLEAAMIARRIVEQRDRFPFSRVAILVRSTTSLDILLPALAGAGIPYLLTKGRSFYETRESRDLLALLKSLANTCDEVSLCVVLRSPFAGVRDEDLLRLKLAGNLYESIAGERSHDGLRRFQEWFAGLHAVRDQLAPDRLLAAAIDSSDYSAGLDWRARANIEKFMSMVRDLWNARPRPLADLVADLDMLRQSQPEPEAPPASKPEAVQVMTVHAAKGLEFPVVFLPFLHRAVDRSSSPLLISPRFGLGARWHDPRSGEPAGDLAWRAAREDEKQRDLAESNRLLYVGMTRAEERLVLSYSRVSQWAAVVDGALPSHVTRCDAIPASTAPANPAEDSQPLVLPPPIIDGQHDSSASVTDIALFADCPRRYFLERYLKLPAAETPGGAGEPAGAEFGREVHAVLSGDGQTASIAARQLAGRFLSNPLASRLSRAARVEREFDIVFALDDLVLQGRIDLWFEEAGELVLVDYKTDLDPNDAYQHQLRLYAFGLERMLGRRPDKALIFYLRTGAVISVNLEAGAMEATSRVVTAFSEAQSELNFPLVEGERCRHCPYYWDACPAGLMPPALPAKLSATVRD